MDEKRLTELVEKYHISTEMIDGKEHFLVLVHDHPEGTAPRDAMESIGMERAGYANDYAFELFCRPEKENMTYEQVKTAGRLYRLLTDFLRPSGAKSAELVNASMNPMVQIAETLRVIKLTKRIPPKMDRKISGLLDGLPMSDRTLPPLSLVLQGVFMIGYTLGCDENPIARVRKGKGLTQEQLASIIGATQGEISRWESYAVTPSLQNLKRLADALGCEVFQLS